MLEAKDLPGLKEDELIKLGPCAVCGEKLLSGGELTFYKLTISRGIFNYQALQRRVGLTMMMSGNDVIARVLSPNEDLAKVISGPVDIVIHERCAGNILHLLELFPKEEEDD